MDEPIVHIKFELFTYYDEELTKKDASDSGRWTPGQPFDRDNFDVYFTGKAKVYINDQFIGEQVETESNAWEVSTYIGCFKLADTMRLSEPTAMIIYDLIFEWMMEDNKNHIFNGVVEFDLNLTTEEVTNISGNGNTELLDYSEYNEVKVIVASYSIPLFEDFESNQILKIRLDYWVEDNGEWYDGPTLEDGVPYKEGHIRFYINDVKCGSIEFDGEESDDITYKTINKLSELLVITNDVDIEHITDELNNMEFYPDGTGKITFDLNIVNFDITNFEDIENTTDK